jgi:hypothetical protein
MTLVLQARGRGFDQQRPVFAGQPAAILDDGGEVLVARPPGQPGRDGAQRRRLVRDRRGTGIEQDAVERGQAPEHGQEAGELDRCAATDRALV